MRRLLPPHLFLACLVAMAAVHLLWPGPRLVPWPHCLLGVLPLVGGLGMAVWGSRRFARAATNIETFGRPQHLVTDGLFRHTRNPMYLGFVLALVGAWIALGSGSPGVVVLAFAVVTDRWYIRFEEAVMQETFGEDYAAYRQRTRRWL